MKGPGFRWSPMLVVLVACGGRAAHPAEHTGGAGGGGSEPMGKAGAEPGPKAILRDTAYPYWACCTARQGSVNVGAERDS